jgi:cytochrome c-type biogenesis protein CcmH/NrfG
MPIFKTILKWLLYALATTPLWLSGSYFFPYISAKVLFVRTIITLAWVAFAVLLFHKETRGALFEKLRALKSLLGVWFAVAWVAVIGIGIFFAKDSYRAFFGDVERGEGFLGILFFFLFFVLALVVFEKKEWIRFFQLHLGVGAILFIDGLVEFLGGVVRVSSFTGNPIYCAQFFLFVIFSALMVWNYYAPRLQSDTSISDYAQKPNIWWRIGAIVSVLYSLVGIVVLTQTRGVMVGIVGGVIGVLVYALWRGKKTIVWGATNLRTLAGAILIVCVVCGGIFVATRNASLWQKIPGVDRIAQTLSGVGTETRQIAFGIGLDSMNPNNEGIGRLIIGWGQENFKSAYNTYFNPEYFQHEQKWFDRAHNKLMDVFVMNGVVGLIAYCGLWILVMMYLFRGNSFSFARGAGIFFGIAYFIQNLTVFDSVVTYIPFFAFMAWAIYGESVRVTSVMVSSSRSSFGEAGGEKQKNSKEQWWEKVVVYKGVLVSVVLVYALIAWVWIPIGQTRSFLRIMRGSVLQEQQAGVIMSSLIPYTYAQDVIRTNLVRKQIELYDGSEQQTKAMIIATNYMQELLEREPTDPRLFITAGQGYEAIGRQGSKEYLLKALELYTRAQELAPKRQDIFYQRAYNYIYQGNDAEAKKILDEAIALDSRVATSHFYKGLFYAAVEGQQSYQQAIDSMEYAFSLRQGIGISDPNNITAAYYLAMKYFYDIRNAKYARITALRLQELAPKSAEDLQKIIGFIDDGSFAKVQWGN